VKKCDCRNLEKIKKSIEEMLHFEKEWKRKGKFRRSTSIRLSVRIFTLKKVLDLFPNAKRNKQEE